MSNKEYNASSIQVVDQRTHLKKRMSLTLGEEQGDSQNPFSSQKSVAIREIIDNSVDEVLGGHAGRIGVKFSSDGSVTVSDNGRGLPVDIGKDGHGNPASGIYLTLGIIQSGGKFTTDSDRFTGGLNGVGAASTVAVSSRADITVYRDNRVYELSFKDGDPGFFEGEGPSAKFTPAKDNAELKISKDTRSAAEKKLVKTGTTVRLWLDDSSFASKYPINRLDITERLRGTAFLIPEIYIDVINEVDLRPDVDGNMEVAVDQFHFENGIEELVLLNKSRDPIAETIMIETEANYTENVPVLQKDGAVKFQDIKRRAPLQIALSWDSSFENHIESYVNTIRTRLGGVHEDALQRALVAGFNSKITTMRGMVPSGTEAPIWEDYLEGLSIVISAYVSEPQFTGQSKEKLGGKEYQRAVQRKLTEVITEWANAPRNFEQMRVLGKKISDASKARQAQMEERQLKRKAASIENTGNLPLKLVDCEVTFDDNSELYIVEGESAKTALQEARFPSHQALFPLKGKIINVNKASMKAVLANKEVQGIIRCLSAGMGDTFEIEKLRFGRVFFATDADVDGGSISATLVMFFWKFFRPMLEEGRIYQLMTPLFQLVPRRKGVPSVYAMNDQEFEEAAARFRADGITFDVKRFKGLGESGQDVLVETGMNPQTRTVKRITINDVERAERMLDIALGDDVAPRKEWIENNPFDEEALLD